MYNIKADFFEIIDTEEKAYWLGFIAADGYLTIREKGHHLECHVGIDLHIKDKDHLEKFRLAVTEKPMLIYDKKIRVSIYSQKMFDDLGNHNIAPRKTFKLSELPSTVPVELLHHFIRGYFDGDGCVWIGSQKYFVKSINDFQYSKTLKIGICGTNAFLSSIGKFLDIGPNETCLQKERRRETDTWTLEYSSNKRCEKFFDVVYKDATIFMERKFEKFKQLLK